MSILIINYYFKSRKKIIKFYFKIIKKVIAIATRDKNSSIHLEPYAISRLFSYNNDVTIGAKSPVLYGKRENILLYFGVGPKRKIMKERTNLLKTGNYSR